MVSDPMVFKKDEQRNLTWISLKKTLHFFSDISFPFFGTMCTCGNHVVLSSTVDNKANAAPDSATLLGDPPSSAPLLVPL